MPKAKRHYHHREDVIYKRLKYTLIALVLIPVAVVTTFVFFGPVIGALFGIFSVNRNFDANLDDVAPPPPIFDNPPKATNSENITLKGYAEDGTTIKLYVNGPEAASTVTTSDGTFQIENIGLINGRNTIFAKATDASGNESEKSAILNLQVDNDKPKLEIEAPKDEDVVKNLNKRVLIKGKVSEKATIKINDKPAVLRPDLSFEMLLGVEPGKVPIVVTATDEAGNEEKEEFTITYVLGSE